MVKVSEKLIKTVTILTPNESGYVNCFYSRVTEGATPIDPQDVSTKLYADQNVYTEGVSGPVSAEYIYSLAGNHEVSNTVYQTIGAFVLDPSDYTTALSFGLNIILETSNSINKAEFRIWNQTLGFEIPNTHLYTYSTTPQYLSTIFVPSSGTNLYLVQIKSDSSLLPGDFVACQNAVVSALLFDIGQNTKFDELEDEVITTDSVPTNTLFSIDLSSNAIKAIETMIISKNIDTGECAFWLIYSGFKTKSSITSEVDYTAIVNKDADIESPGYFDFEVDGNIVELKVTGPASDRIRWKGRAHIISDT